MSGVSVCCTVCPGRPVLSGRPDADLRRCVRCQGGDRVLPVPHPADHLCGRCRSECPGCGAPSISGSAGWCRACRGVCERCLVPLPERMPEDVQVVERVRAGPPPSGGRPARTLLFTASPRRLRLCPACRGAAGESAGGGGEQQVLAALPDAVLRACGGTAPGAVVQVIRAELARRTPTQLAERIERRWHGVWANRPLRRAPREDAAGYGPDEVALWLVAAGECRGGCEGGWLPATGDPCPVCQPAPRRPGRPVALSPVAQDMLATARDVLQQAKAARPRGGYVPPPPPAQRPPSPAAREVLERAGGPASRRREMSPAQARADPVRARAIATARAQRGQYVPAHLANPGPAGAPHDGEGGDRVPGQ